MVMVHFAARYGDWILLAPRTELAWLIPPLTLVAGAAGLILWLRRRTPARPSTLAAEEIGRLAPMRKRVRREVHELDA
jgi:cytochrome c-type biogenesis protein CcmH/NrfF